MNNKQVITEINSIESAKNVDELLIIALNHIKETGKIIRYLDENTAYSDFWWNDDDYTPFTERVETTLKKTDGIMVNGYRINYNPLWAMWQCLYDGARYGEFKLLADAIDYCEKG